MNVATAIKPVVEPALVTRVATPDDLEELMNLAMMACDENGFLNPTPHMLLEQIYPALHQDNGIVGCVGPQDGAIEGAILLRTGVTWYSTVPILEEKGLFILPQFRNAKGGRGKMLCEFSKHTADMLGMPLMIGVLSNHRTAGKIRLYSRLFGEPSGAFFLYGAKTGERFGLDQGK